MQTVSAVSHGRKRLERLRSTTKSFNLMPLNPIFDYAFRFRRRNDPTYAACVLEDHRGAPFLELLKP